MADKTFVDGAVLPASDLNTYLAHTGGVWNSFTPVLTQSGTPAIVVNRGVYWRAGRKIVCQVVVTVTGTGTANNKVTVTLPVTAVSQTNLPVGSGHILDFSVSAFYPTVVIMDSTTTVSFFTTSTNVNTVAGITGSAFSAALASNDVVSFTVTYEAAAG